MRDALSLMERAEQEAQVGLFEYRVAEDQLSWSAGHRALFGASLPAGSGLAAWFAAIHEEDREQVERDVWTACALRRHRQVLEYRIARPDGSVRCLSSRLVLAYDAGGHATGMAGVTVDLTERAHAARQEAEAASRAQDEFLTLLGHDLRNPLGAISAAAEVLAIAPPDSEGASEARSVIARQTRHLAHRVNELMDMGRVGTGKVVLTRQPVDLADVARRTHARLSASTEAQHHALHVEGDAAAWVEGDAVRLEQAVAHLVEHALRHAPHGVRVDLTVRRDGDAAILEVRSASLDASPVRQPDGAGEPAHRRAAAIGFRLMLVRRVVELHGGTVSAEGSAAGMCLRVRLPAIDAPPLAAPQENARSQRRSVLVIGDDAAAMAALQSQLELEGHRVSTAVDATAGLDHLLALRPEVSIVNVALPRLAGFELARHARAAGYSGRMIALSGDAAPGALAHARGAGFDACLTRPVDRGQLRATLSED